MEGNFLFFILCYIYIMNSVLLLCIVVGIYRTQLIRSMKMKKQIPLIFSFALFSILVNAQWHQTNGPYDCNIRSMAVCGSKIFAGTDFQGIYSSSDNGNNWTFIGNGIDIFALASKDNIIFEGTAHGLVISSDSGATWTYMNNILSNYLVVSIKIDGSNVFVGTGGGGMFFSNDNGNNWSAINNGLTGNNIFSIAVSGNDVYAGTNQGMFHSSNYGNSWSSINNGITSSAVWSIVVSGSNIFAGNAEGVFLSTNQGGNWDQVNNGLTNTVVHTLVPA